MHHPLSIATHQNFSLFFTGDIKADIPKKNTFILSNMAPQYSTHNTHPWNHWEQYVREIAKELNGIQLFVITGVAGQEDSTLTLVNLHNLFFCVVSLMVYDS